MAVSFCNWMSASDFAETLTCGGVVEKLFFTLQSEIFLTFGVVHHCQWLTSMRVLGIASAMSHFYLNLSRQRCIVIALAVALLGTVAKFNAMIAFIF